MSRKFDDVLIAGVTGHLPPQRLEQLDPWPLRQAVAYNPSFAAGHQALRYDVEPEQGFEQAKAVMAKAIERDCKRDIGGDEQRVESMNTKHGDVTFKHVLLPVWVGAYLYSGKPHQMLVNGVTAEVQGDRPYSAVKILLAVMAALVVIVTLVLLYSYNA